MTTLMEKQTGTHNYSQTLMMCGSRDDSAALRQLAVDAVYRARDNGWKRILVGDALGIDQVVVKACEHIKLPYLAVGITRYPRNGAKHYQWILSATAGRAGFQYRDRYLADRSAAVLCFWNGESQGTLNVYEYMRIQQKPAHLITADVTVPQWPTAL